MNPGIVMQFLTSLYISGLSTASVTSTLSALNYINKLTGSPDLYQNFCLSRLLKGMKSVNPSKDTRLPITPEILTKLCEAVSKIFNDGYQKSLLRAMFLLAFYGFLRIGEISCEASSTNNKNLLHLHNINVDKTSKAMVISFTDYKHKTTSNSFNLAISPQTGGQCPVKAMVEYLKVRGHLPGPLFLFHGMPVRRSYFTSSLHKLLKYLKYNTDLYKTHSFRIGAATTAIARGLSADQVKLMGRWKSDAYKSYIRVKSISM